MNSLVQVQCIPVQDVLDIAIYLYGGEWHIKNKFAYLCKSDFSA